MSAVSTFEQAQILAIEPAAARHLLRHVRSNPNAIGVRIGVKDSGCSGYAYVMDLTETVPENHLRIAADEQLALYLDVKSVPALSGSTLRLVKEGVNETIKFDNPNAGSYCGCGESFTVDPEIETQLNA
jgi:iron-sulfur cluster assembly accessory protein